MLPSVCSITNATRATRGCLARGASGCQKSADSCSTSAVPCDGRHTHRAGGVRYHRGWGERSRIFAPADESCLRASSKELFRDALPDPGSRPLRPRGNRACGRGRSRAPPRRLRALPFALRGRPRLQGRGGVALRARARGGTGTRAVGGARLARGGTRGGLPGDSHHGRGHRHPARRSAAVRSPAALAHHDRAHALPAEEASLLRDGARGGVHRSLPLLRFFRPFEAPPEPDLICSAGQLLRDYPTLVEAVRGLPLRLRIAAGSPWIAKELKPDAPLPENVQWRRYSRFELRELYRRSAICIVPIQENDYQTGISTILEMMAMGKCVIATRTRGQTDTLVDGVNGIYVPPGDVPALRAAILRTLERPEETARIGAAAR